MLQMFIAAYILGVIIAIPVGPVTIAAGRRAITAGFFPAFFFNMGSLTSDGLYVLMVYLGLSPLLTQSELLKLVMWIIGGAWLCWLGWEAINTQIDSSSLTIEEIREPRWRSFGSGVAVTLFNPLTIVSWIALAGNFFAGWRDDWGDPDTWGFAAMIVILIGVATWAIGLSVLLSSMRRFVSPRLLRGVSIAAGVMLVLFGISAWVSAVSTLV